MIEPTIVVPAYNRSNTLQRLLKSIVHSKGIEHARLIISIDHHPDNASVIELAQSFDWPGEKEVVIHTQNKGLREHILWCGDLTEKYKAIIVLEDDLLVSPLFYLYSRKAINFYDEERNIASISLYSYNYNESVNLPFYPLKGKSDVYFIQYASSWGQMWTYLQWKEFRAWYNINLEWDASDERIPSAPRNWPERSWKKYFIKYLIDTSKYVVYPYFSLSTNFGEPGANSGMVTNEHQALLNLDDDHFDLEKFGDESITYDAYFQIGENYLKQRQLVLTDYSFDVDVYGGKPTSQLRKKFVITTRKCTDPEKSFGLELYPPELNLIYAISGNALHLTTTDNLLETEKMTKEKIRYFYKVSDWFWGYLYRLLPSLKLQIINQAKYHLKKVFRINN